MLTSTRRSRDVEKHNSCCVRRRSGLQVKDENGDLHNLELNYYASGEFVGFICRNLLSLDLCEEVLCELLDASGCLIEGTEEYDEFFDYEDDEDDFEEDA